MCKILTARYINPEVFSTMMPRIWGTEGLVKIEKAGNNAYLCKFKSGTRQESTEEPLKRGTNVKIGSMAEKTWIPITYEKLPDFCYYCGKLGHVFQECTEIGADSSKEKI